MDCRAIPVRQLPHQPELFLDFIDHFPSVSRFYAHPPKMSEVTRVAKSLDYPPERRREVTDILRRQNADLGAGKTTLENLTRLEKGAVAVVSGQQVGLFGGPGYSLYKALSAIQIAQELTHGGIPSVPVFWMATEDHDLEEVRHSTWFYGGKLVRFELPGDAGAGLPVGRVMLDPQVEEMAYEAARILTTAGGELLSRIFQESYRAEETYGSAFGKLFARLFAEQGLILLDPLDAQLHQLAEPILHKVLEDRDALNEALLQRNKELDEADYGAQVKVTARSTLVFHMGSGIRQAITANGGKFRCGDKTWKQEELLRALQMGPEKFSPNALLRPVLQDFLLPTVAYIAGPTEIAYFAQAEVIYKGVLGRMPVILPRLGITFLDAKAEKLLHRYGLKAEDVWSGSQEVRRKMERASVTRALAAKFDRDMKQTKQMLLQLRKQMSRIDSTLAGAVDTAQKKILFHLEKLRRKAGKAQDEKARLIEGHEQFLESFLYPHKTLQSRELNFLPFLARLGMGGLGELQKLAHSKKLGAHYIVRIP